MIASCFIVDSLAEPLKIHDLPAIFQDMETGSQFSSYCYYCEICEEMFALCPNFIDPENVRWAFHDRCPSCHWRLGSSLRCTRIKVPDQIGLQLHPACKSLTSINLSTKPREASLTSYLLEGEESSERTLQPSCKNLIEDPLENLLGRSVVLHGDRAAHELSELICVKAQMKKSYGGLDSKVIFIDGGNIFDPYLICRYADRYQIRREKVLDGTQIGRAFTCHQLTSLITRALPDALENYQARLAVVADITKLYMDPDIEEREAFNTFNQVSMFLARLAEKKGSIVLATCITASRHGYFESILFSRAHTVFEICEGSKPTLVKHSP